MKNSCNVIGGGPSYLISNGGIDILKMASELYEKIKEIKDNLDTVNIMVIGKTGVGKSTLVNAVFNTPLAETGKTNPVTKNIVDYTTPGAPLKIYDTKGLELNNLDEVKKQIINKIRECASSGNVKNKIHCIWYCISHLSNRVEDAEIKFIDELCKETKVPVIIVLTQCISFDNLDNDNIDDEMCNYLKTKIPSAKQKHIFPVLAKSYPLGAKRDPIPPGGLDKLVRFTMMCLPENLMMTFNYVQKVCLQEKINQSQICVKTAVGLASAAVLNPIPFSDCAVLIPIQLSMMASISIIFGLDLNKKLLLQIITAVLGTGGATIVGRTVVSNLLKLIPGVGSVVGGLISSGTAGIITSALGNAYIKIMERIYKGELSQKDLESGRAKQIMKEIYLEERAKS